MGSVFLLVVIFGLSNYKLPSSGPWKTDVTYHQFVLLEAHCSLELDTDKIAMLLRDLNVGSVPVDKRKKIAEYIVWHEIHECMVNKAQSK